MKLSDIFTADAIKLDMDATDKETVLRELALLLQKAHPTLSQEKVLDVLLAREKLGSTAIGEGVAIPHGKMEGLSQVIGAFARSRRGIDFTAYDEKKTQLFFILLAPEGQRGVSDHLKILAKISRLLRNDEFREKLQTLDDVQELYQLLVRADN